MAPATSAAPSTVSDDGSGPTIKPVAVKAPPKACAPTDQDRYVYNPARLQVVTACLQVTGTVAAIRMEADGDLHLLIRLGYLFGRPADASVWAAAEAPSTRRRAALRAIAGAASVRRERSRSQCGHDDELLCCQASETIPIGRSAIASSVRRTTRVVAAAAAVRAAIGESCPPR